MAKRTSGATEINGFINVGNNITEKNKTVRKVNQAKTNVNKEEVKVRKPGVNVVKNEQTKAKTNSNGSLVKKASITQNDLDEKKKALVNKRTPENVAKITVKRDIQSTDNKIPAKRNIQTKVNTNLTKTTTKPVVEQQRPINAKPIPTKISSTKVEPKKNVEIQPIKKSKILPIGKDVEQKKNVRVPINSQKVTTRNNKPKEIIKNTPTGQSNKSKTTKNSTKKEDTSTTVEITRQGTWVKESSQNAESTEQSRETNEGPTTDIENYESEFEQETSVSERVDNNRSKNSQSKMKTNERLNNKSHPISARKKDIENMIASKTVAGCTESINDNKPDSGIEQKNWAINNDEQLTTNNEQSQDSYYDYDDDFEEYESDFEEDTESGLSVTSAEESGNYSEKVTTESSTNEDEGDISVKKLITKAAVEEERKLDSGNYDLTTKIVLSEAVKQRQLDEIKEAISKENSSYLER